MTVRATILTQMENIARQQRKTLKPVTDDLALIESGLDSLCLAILVANLDDELGVDPFGAGDGVEVPKTVGEFVHLYEVAAMA